MTRLCFLADNTITAQESLARLKKRYDATTSSKAEAFVILGGDGFMLQMLHKYIDCALPFYGMNKGRLGFLMNQFNEETLLDSLSSAVRATLHPLVMQAYSSKGKEKKAFAFNEVSLLRQTRQAADISIRIDGEEKLPHLICDGVLLSTPAGSTAYNYSVNGPILPLTSKVLALTPISPFRPRRWKGAVLSAHTEVSFEILDNEKRPVSVAADFTELRNVTKVHVKQDHNIGLHLLFDAHSNLEERVLNEQFLG